MVNIERYYDGRAGEYGDEKLLEQVGHTENGRAISDSELSILLAELRAFLDLKEEDRLLDLGCGNGVISEKLSHHCFELYGVDMSERMIETAINLNKGDKCKFFKSDILKLNTDEFNQVNFTKVLMFGVLQHLKHTDISALFNQLLPICTNQARFLIGFIPNIDKKNEYYNSVYKKVKYQYYKLMGRDLMGTWWSKSEIKEQLRMLGLDCTFIDVDKGRYGYPYRFHVIIWRT